MKEPKKYTCGQGEGMFEDTNGFYVEHSEYEKLKEYNEELFDLAYNNCNGLAHDELYEIVNKYE